MRWGLMCLLLVGLALFGAPMEASAGAGNQDHSGGWRMPGGGAPSAAARTTEISVTLVYIGDFFPMLIFTATE